jgi:glucosylceramidase
MHIRQYLTAENLEFVTREIFPSVHMPGAYQLKRTGKILSDDFLGFGVAITGSSCYDLALMEANERTALIRNLYTKDGIGLSIARLSVASSDYSAELYSYDDVENDTALEHFSIDRDKAYIIPMIKEILAENPDLYLFASPWSPPGWMKTSGSLCGGYMRMEYIDCYADYIIRFLEEYEKCGIHISALTPQNEPETQQHSQMPACIWHPDIEAAFIKVLRRKLDEKGMDVKIWMYDYNFDNWVRVKWALDHHAGLKDACDGVAFHYYRGAIEQTAALQEAYPDLKLHFTEGGPRLYDNYATDWCKWSIMMSKVLNRSYRSFTGWNLMLDETGGPNIGPFFCGGLVTRNSVTGALSYSGQYKAFRQVARFMDAGAVVEALSVVDRPNGMSTYPKANAPLQASVWKNPNGTVVYLLINPDSEKKQIELEENGQTFYVELLPNSVSTVVIAE